VAVDIEPKILAAIETRRARPDSRARGADLVGHLDRAGLRRGARDA
jgi:hypothetical protein